MLKNVLNMDVRFRVDGFGLRAFVKKAFCSEHVYTFKGLLSPKACSLTPQLCNETHQDCTFESFYALLVLVVASQTRLL